MKSIKYSNKGFSLVELIAAVAILAVVVTPLLHSFVTSTNISRKATIISEATLAGKNILETIDATSVSEWQEIVTNGRAADLLKDEDIDVSVTPIGRFDRNGILETDNGNFTVGLTNIKGGNNLYDAKVEFTRGDIDETYEDANGIAKDSTSHGLYLINDEDISKYTGMDGVFCQSELKTANPDILVDKAYEQKAKIESEVPEKYNSRERYIFIQTWKDSEGFVYADVYYTYKFNYTVLDRDGYPTESTKNWPVEFNIGNTDVTFHYSLFPGGFQPRNKDGSVSLYLMYFPDYYKYKNEDTGAEGVRAHKDIIDVFNVAEEGHEVDLKVFIYKQKPIWYNSETDTYDELNTSGVMYPVEIHMFKPDDYEISGDVDDRETLIYTNALQNFTDTDIINFKFVVAQASYQGDINYDDFEYNPEDPYSPQIWYGSENANYATTFNLIRREKEIRIYNIKITLYPKNSFIPAKDISEEVYGGKTYNIVDTTGSSFSGEPVYIVEGSKTP